MRISDWSSDVCSSDLPAAHVDSFQLTWLFSEAAQGAADANELLRAAGQIRSGNREDWYSAFSALAERLQEIGRASCRERVGQDVYISVVAVSINKQLNVTIFNEI